MRASFPAGREQAYLCERDGLSLVGTAEVPVTAYHTDEILAESDLPLKFVAMSPCFPREAGAAGKDTHGLYRIHLFEKVEQVIIGPSDEQRGPEFHDEIVRNSEDVMQALKLPYRRQLAQPLSARTFRKYRSAARIGTLKA